jgi:hypothetical protein
MKSVAFKLEHILQSKHYSPSIHDESPQGGLGAFFKKTSDASVQVNLCVQNGKIILSSLKGQLHEDIRSVAFKEVLVRRCSRGAHKEMLVRRCSQGDACE